MIRVHPTAVIEAGAQLAPGVEVGSHATIGPDVCLASGVVVEPHAVVCGRTQVGQGTRIHSFAAVGGAPQDRDHRGESTTLEIGCYNVIREHVTIHVGTLLGGGRTRIGDHNYLMNASHVAHDCQVGSHCVISSFAGLGGHAVVEDHAVLGAYTGVHQFARVGESVMSAANAKVSMDVPPFALVAGDRARILGLNQLGMERRNFSSKTRSALKHAFHVLFHSKLRLGAAVQKVRDELPGVPEVEHLVGFLERSERGFCR